MLYMDLKLLILNYADFNLLLSFMNRLWKLALPSLTFSLRGLQYTEFRLSCGYQGEIH